MTYPPLGGPPDPNQPQQPYAPPVDPTRPFPSEPASGGPQPPYLGQPQSFGQQPGNTFGQPYGGAPGGYPQPEPYAPQGGYGPGSQPGYVQQPYGAPAPYGAPMYSPTPTTNTLAILSLVFAFVFPIAGIVMGHIAKRQIKETGEQGDGLATAGLWLGYAFTALGLLVCIGYGILIAVAVGNSDGSTGSF